MFYVVSTAGDGPEQAIMLEAETQVDVAVWQADESDRPHKVVEAANLDDLAVKCGHPIIDFDANVHLVKNVPHEDDGMDERW